MQIASSPIGDQSIPAFLKQPSIFLACLLDIPLPNTIPKSGSQQNILLPPALQGHLSCPVRRNISEFAKSKNDGMGAGNAFQRVSAFLLGLLSKQAHQVDQAAGWHVCTSLTL